MSPGNECVGVCRNKKLKSYTSLKIMQENQSLSEKEIYTGGKNLLAVAVVETNFISGGFLPKMMYMRISER